MEKLKSSSTVTDFWAKNFGQYQWLLSPRNDVAIIV